MGKREGKIEFNEKTKKIELVNEEEPVLQVGIEKRDKNGNVYTHPIYRNDQLN